MSALVPMWQLRARFAAALSALYGREVPAYTTLVRVSEEVNRRVIAREGAAAQRLGSIERVTAERHGAIRVGTAREMAQVARIFGAVGMHATGFYDLREAAPSPIPVISTAFRPADRDELARNPFRVFTSMLVPDDRRFFDADTQSRLETFLAGRELFSPELLTLADRSTRDGGLVRGDAARFLDLATSSFALSPEPVDRGWYEQLEAISSVAADIGGVGSTHINHLTPRVLDIDDLYASMQAEGVTMIDEIQGPPRWDGPDILLRQTSFRALAEPRTFREADGSVGTGQLRVRFGEVEARGVALTPAGRVRYEALVAEVDRRLAGAAEAGERPPRADVAREVWRHGLPGSDVELAAQGLGYYTVTVARDRPVDAAPPQDLATLARDGWVDLEPVVYEDFLPASAAGIFASNLSSEGTVDRAAQGAARDEAWLADVVGGLADPYEGYARQRDESLAAVVESLGLGASVELPGAAPA